MLKSLALGILTVTLFVSSFAKADEFRVPELTSPVMDEAGVIGGNRLALLNKLIREANARDKVQLTVLTLQSLNGFPIEQASIQIVDKWKLGKSGKDNGVLFIVIPGERKARIEVGRGLEGDIPDVIAKRILADVSRPYFKRGLYGDGILAGTVEILKRADPDFTPEGYTQHRTFPTEKKLPSGLVIFILIAVLLILRVLASGFWGGGGGFGGGGWSGGGGGFSGGGSSDSW